MRILVRGTRVFEKARSPSPAWDVEEFANGRYLCSRSDGLSQHFDRAELETFEERNERGRELDAARKEADDKMMGRERKPRPLYEV
jgi:hypothetical protein